MFEDLQQTLKRIEDVNKFLKRGLITFNEFLELKSELYNKAYRINDILEIEYEYKNILN